MAVYEAWRNTFKVGVQGRESSESDFKEIADIESFDVSVDGNVEEWNPFTEKGWTRRLKTGSSITITVSGKRNVGDAANDYIAGLAFKTGSEATTILKWTMFDGTVITLPVVVNVTNAGTGATRDVAALEAEFLSDGAPTIVEAD
jgi:hypothetical protein